MMLGPLGPLLSLGPGVGGAAPDEQGSHRCLAREEEKGRNKKGGLLRATETEGTVVSFFQEEAEELLENIVVSIGVATFKCGRGKGKGKGSGTDLFNIFT